VAERLITKEMFEEDYLSSVSQIEDLEKTKW